MPGGWRWGRVNTYSIKAEGLRLRMCCAACRNHVLGCRASPPCWSTLDVLSSTPRSDKQNDRQHEERPLPHEDRASRPRAQLSMEDTGLRRCRHYRLRQW